MYKSLTATIIASTLLLSSSVLASDGIYAQASKGSFNDAAITKLFEQQPNLKAPVNFAGTPSNTFKESIKNNALAFTAVENSTIKGRLVAATVQAFQQYKVVEIKGFITTPIEMCVLMNHQDVTNKVKINTIASHPAALKQINKWKNKFHPKELSIPEGTAAAARMVANHKLPSGTAAIGACVLNTVYPTLDIVAKGVQDNKNNKTSFLLLNLAPRAHKLSQADARKALTAAIKTGKQLKK